MASPAREIEAVDEVYLGEVRKYGIDAQTPWWERWFFRAVFLPFVRFSFKRMHVPAHGAVDKDGRFSWVETVIVTFDKERALAACGDEFYCVRTYSPDASLPRESLQHKGHSYPNSVMPDRYRRCTFPLTSAPVVGLTHLAQEIETLSRKAADA